MPKTVKMSIKKRIISLFLVSALSLGILCSCDSEEKSSETSDSSKETVSAESTADEQSSKEESEELSAEQPSEESSAEDVEKTGIFAVDELLGERKERKQGENSSYKPLNYKPMKAMWISQFDFQKIYSTGTKQRSEAKFRKYLETALDKVQALGFNTVIVQVRPNADSFYPSEYYPWSHFINGTYGKFASYDPMKIFIEEAHKRELSFQAWINPLRGMATDSAAILDENYPMSKWLKDSEKKRYLFVGEYDGKPSYYLNCYYEEVRQLIIDGAAEIVRYYDVDGVHMDDYFYPGNDTNMDNLEFAKERKDNPSLTLKDFRYSSLNKLVSGIYSAVKAENPNVLFGISPAGNINNVRNSHYADVDTWCSSDGYIDYIMPQIYWGFEHSICPFAPTYQLWAKLCTSDSVDFMVGLTMANAIYGYEGIYYDEFINNKDIYKKTFNYMASQPTFEGFSVFCYQYYYNPLTGDAREDSIEEITNAQPAMDAIKSEKIKY